MVMLFKSLFGASGSKDLADQGNQVKSSPDSVFDDAKPNSEFVSVSMTVNGKAVSGEVEGRTRLVQFLRENLRLTGTHVGCDTSQCGACTIHLNGQPVKSCAVLALQAEDTDIVTIEGLANGDELHPMQEAFRKNHGLQCGFCTPGMVMAAIGLVNEIPEPTESDIRHYLEGNICRCTGYHNIVKSISAGAVAMKKGRSDV